MDLPQKEQWAGRQDGAALLSAVLPPSRRELEESEKAEDPDDIEKEEMKRKRARDRFGIANRQWRREIHSIKVQRKVNFGRCVGLLSLHLRKMFVRMATIVDGPSIYLHSYSSSPITKIIYVIIRYLLN